ncbi:MAG: hypothetical protein ACIAXF_07270 [Phycisphaerales bacterium JB063]
MIDNHIDDLDNQTALTLPPRWFGIFACLNGLPDPRHGTDATLAIASILPTAHPLRGGRLSASPFPDGAK